MSAEEVGQYGVGAIGELGKQLCVYCDTFGSIALEKARAWFVIVECPKLSLLRHKYGLPAKEGWPSHHCGDRSSKPESSAVNSSLMGSRDSTARALFDFASEVHEDWDAGEP